MSTKTLRNWIPVTLVALAFIGLSTFLGQMTVSADSAPDMRAAFDNLGSDGITTGADVTIIHLQGIQNWGATGGIRGYSVGTDSCNIGSEPLNWCDDNNCEAAIGGTEKHPVIAQNLYRLQDGRFEQIGMSWLKHGFLSTNSFDPDCFGNDGQGQPTSCVQPPEGSDQLGVGCTDFYSAGLNGSQPLGRRSEVNAATGLFPFPPTGGGDNSNNGQRLQVQESDMSGEGDRFWIEGHYVGDNDALDKNGLNNASYREVTVSPGSFNLSTTGPTVRERVAMYAWQAVDPEVEIVFADAEGAVTERFHAGRRITSLGGGQWRYDYAIHNMNSDRSARSFRVDFDGPASISNVGFRDVDHHSNEPFSTADWAQTVSLGGGFVEWSTETFAVNPNANALRWGTMFSFSFETDQGPEFATHTLGLFKDGAVMELDVPFSTEGTPLIYGSGFETGDTDQWSDALP